MSIIEWKKFLVEAKAANDLVWKTSDPWERGSPGWEEFLAPADRNGGSATKPASRVVPVPVGRALFEEYVKASLPTKGRSTGRSEVLLALAKYGQDGANIFPANATIAKEVGLRREAVNRHIRAAISDGLLIKVGMLGRTNCYQLSVPVVK